MEQPPDIVLRAPSTLSATSLSAYKSPDLGFLKGTWHVTHSTLPMWKSKRNVRITYTLLEPSSPSIPAEQTDRLDDVVTYQGLNSDSVSTVHGVDKASGGAGVTDVWDWRGKGWLMIASSHWEVLGWGQGNTAQDEAWVVTYFAKTLFTPAGIDIYSRRAEGLKQETVGQIKKSLSEIDSAEFRTLADGLFEVPVDSTSST